MWRPNRRTVVAAILSLGTTVGCKGGDRRNAPTKAPIAASPSAADAREANSSVPPLQPMATGPFPQGATEEQVCKAIADTGETDLWVRFGHLVPAYQRGVVFILDAGPDRVQRVEDFVLKEYLGGGTWAPQVKGCAKAGQALLYVRMLGPDAPLPDGRMTGRTHLSAELEKATGIRTSGTYQFEARDQATPDRLAEYCRSDAVLCEKLVRLLSGDEAKGLCPFALSRMGIDAFDTRRPALLATCQERTGPPFACVEFAFQEPEKSACSEAIRRELGISAPP